MIRSATVFLLLLFLLILSSCGSTRILEQDQLELVDNKIQIKSPARIEDREALLLNLDYFILQKVNKPNLVNPRRYLGNSPITVFDEEKALQTATSMHQYLKNKKGFYNNTVKHIVKYNQDRGVKVTYLIETGKRYRVNSISYTSDDQNLEKIIRELQKDQLIQQGSPLDAALFDQEKARIASELQNRGYANFVANYIEIIGVDSANYETDVVLNVLPPLPDSTHIQYRIGNINVYTEHLANDSIIVNKTRDYYKQTYHAKGSDFVVNPKVLSRSIFLKKDDLYKKNNRLKSFRKLSQLSTYRYVYINPVLQTAEDSLINFDIFLTPHQKKWVWDIGSDLFYSTFNQAGNKLFGVSLNSGLQNRNFLGGAELFTTNAEAILEFNIPSFSLNSVGVNLQNTLKLPRYVELFGFSKMLRGIQILKGDRYKKFREESTSEIRIGYNYTQIIDFYSIQSFNASWGYDYRPSSHSRFVIQQLGLNILNPEPDSIFQDILNRNPLLSRSFEPVLATGFIFRDLTYLYQGPVNRNGVSYGFLGDFEVSGLETFLFNKIYNGIANKDDVWKLNNLDFAKYVKLELDGKLYKKLGRGSSLAFRLATGLAVPYGGQGVVPFTSQFFVGGPNSVRAWQIRELGPGGYSDLQINPVEDQPFFQSGEFKLEFNAEYRQHLFWYVEGALFFDGGNVWSLKEDIGRPGAKLSSSFLDQMALGFGYGLRFDFDYFIIRFDFGFKLRSPFPDENGSHYVLNKKRDVYPYANSYPFGNINVAINYPF